MKEAPNKDAVICVVKECVVVNNEGADPDFWCKRKECRRSVVCDIIRKKETKQAQSRKMEGKRMCEAEGCRGFLRASREPNSAIAVGAAF